MFECEFDFVVEEHPAPTGDKLIELFKEYCSTELGVNLDSEGFTVTILSERNPAHGWPTFIVGHENPFMLAELEVVYTDTARFHHGETEDDAFHYSLATPFKQIMTDDVGAAVIAALKLSEYSSGPYATLYGADDTQAKLAVHF